MQRSDDNELKRRKKNSFWPVPLRGPVLFEEKDRKKNFSNQGKRGHDETFLTRKFILEAFVMI